MKKLVVVRWTDPALHVGQDIRNHDIKNSMVHKLTAGFLYGTYKDDQNIEFYRICNNFDTDSSCDDFIDIPIDLVHEMIETNVEMNLNKRS